MTDDYIRKRFKHTIDTLSVPWEPLRIVFQRIMQRIPQNQKAVTEKTADEIEKDSKNQKDNKK